MREHYAMRRDKIKTPDAQCRKGSNTMPALQWAENMEAINDLKPGTCVREHFTDLLRKKASARRRERTAARNLSGIHPSDAMDRATTSSQGPGAAADVRGGPRRMVGAGIPTESPFAAGSGGRPQPFAHHNNKQHGGDDDDAGGPHFSDFKKAAATGMW